MNTLRLEEINLHSSYMVGQTEGNKYSFYFDTDFGLRYTISFMLEHSFVQSSPNSKRPSTSSSTKWVREPSPDSPNRPLTHLLLFALYNEGEGS